MRADGPGLRTHDTTLEKSQRCGKLWQSCDEPRGGMDAKVGDYVARLSRLLRVSDIELHVEEVTGADKTLDVVVDIFNRVNSGGTNLSKGDLALAKICAD